MTKTYRWPQNVPASHIQTVVPKMIYSRNNIRKIIYYTDASLAHICAVNTYVHRKMWHWKIISLSLYKCLCAENQPKQSCLFSSLFFSIHFRLTITTCNYNSEWRNRVLPPNEYLSGHESQLWPLAAVRSISLPLLFNNFISAYFKWKGCPVFSQNVLLNVIESISLMRSEEESQKQCLK